MPDVLTTPSSAFRRRRRTQRRTTGYDSCLLHDAGGGNENGQRGKRFLRWTACFAFVGKFKRSKPDKLDFIPEQRRHSAAVTQKTAPDQPRQFNPNHRRPLSHYLERATTDQDSMASTLLQWKDGTTSLPATPLSALSPPPRHAMKERSRSLTADDPLPVVPPLPMPRKRKATTISRSLALRLSLDVDQHYSSSGITHSSSGFSNGTGSDFLKKEEVDDDTASSISSQQRNTTVPPEPKLRLSSIEAATTTTTEEATARRHRVSPIAIPEIEKLTLALQENEDEDDDYDDLLNEFQLPSETLPQQQQTVAVPSKNRETVKEAKNDPLSIRQQDKAVPTPFVSRSTITARELSRQTAMQALEGHFTGSKSMDIVRDKAHYDAVVAGTMHRRPWTQYMRAQPCKEKEDEETSPGIDQKESARHVKAASAVFASYNSKLHRPSLVYFPPSPNSINSDY
ncbi:hypothetical protein BJV82DRAFT_629025 [Fennellomyces sp. T-0311]|nr:hypothetical protein BJV82DRAFT_629025 [Fennellomyces sp. T-0311]